MTNREIIGIAAIAFSITTFSIIQFILRRGAEKALKKIQKKIIFEDKADLMQYIWSYLDSDGFDTWWDSNKRKNDNE